MAISFIYISIIGLLLIFITSFIIYEVFAKVWKSLPRLPLPKQARMIVVILPIFLAHILNIWLYAGVYFLLGLVTEIGQISGLGHVPALTLESFFDCLYFSGVSYTTLGFGDYIATGNLRMLSATEALNGLVLMGWTVSFTYLAMENFWKMTPHQASDSIEL